MTRHTARHTRSFGVAISVLGFATYLMLTAVPAQATVGCSYDSVNRQVNITADGDEPVAIRVGGGGAIEANLDNAGFAQCGIATVNNTDGINIVGLGGLALDAVTIDLSGGTFAPGETPEASGTSEIEIGITNDPSGTIDDDVRALGTSADYTITWGDGGAATPGVGAINLTGDADADVTFSGMNGYFTDGDAGNDAISYAGGSGTGSDAD